VTLSSVYESDESKHELSTSRYVQYVISATTVDTFKAHLDRFWQNQEVIYNWKTDIHIGSRS